MDTRRSGAVMARCRIPGFVAGTHHGKTPAEYAEWLRRKRAVEKAIRDAEIADAMSRPRRCRKCRLKKTDYLQPGSEVCTDCLMKSNTKNKNRVIASSLK